MDINMRAVKPNAKIALKNKWVEAILVFLCLATVCIAEYCTVLLFSSLFGATAIYSLFLPSEFLELATLPNIALGIVKAALLLTVTMPFGMGVFRWYFRMPDEKNDSLSGIFYYYSSAKRFKRALTSGGILLLSLFLIGAVSMIPFYISSALSSAKFYQFLGINMPAYAHLSVFTTVFRVLGAAIYFLLAIRLIWYLPMCVVFENKTPKELLRATFAIFKFFMGHTVSLAFSFFGWYLLSLLVIPMIYTVPYFITSCCTFFRYAINNYNIYFKSYPNAAF